MQELMQLSVRNQEGAGTTAGGEVEQVNSCLSRCALTAKYMSKAARVDRLTLHALGWNHNKRASVHQALSTRYVKTCQRLLDETAKLAELKTELRCADDEMASHWISEVIEWAARGKLEQTTDFNRVQRVHRAGFTTKLYYKGFYM